MIGGENNMGVRTYVPGLRLVLKEVIRYITRYQPVLNSVLTTEQYNCLVATLSAASECLAAIGSAEVLP